MLAQQLIALSAILPFSSAAEQVLGVYIFHRHGDRTAKDWPPANFTALGANQVYASGNFFNKRYIDSSSSLQIKGISSEVAINSQLTVTAPVDTVLHDSAVSFLQGLYPPNKQTQTLANGTKVEAPLGGYQYIPVNAVADSASSSNSENSEWLQGGSGCGNAVVSSNNYFSTKEYQDTYDATLDFYHKLLPVINGTYNESRANFQNGYTIYDLINVARIHNSSISSSSLLTPTTVSTLYNLASTHEWNLAYNESSPVRAIAGSVLAGQILEALTPISNSTAKTPKLNIQFGAYGAFMSFFGLANLQSASNDFYGVVDYASAMAFELVTNSSSKTPSQDDVSVRFYFVNGTAAENKFSTFPLFGQKETTLTWSAFEKGMSKFAVQGQDDWCNLCGDSSPSCGSNNATTSSTGGNDASTSSSSGGVSKPVAGVIGALVTLVVILLVQGLVMLAGGFRLVKKSSLQQASGQVASGAAKSG